MGVALISVSDKTGIVEFAKKLSDYTILSTGGTAKLLEENGISVTKVEDFTGQKEILGGRVKTLHPKIHGGILARDDQLGELEHEPIDLVVANLYPFGETVRNNPSVEEAVEQIDIGGVTLLRAAAKNFHRVTVVCDPADYEHALTADADMRKKLAVKAFRHTANYDATIDIWLSKELVGERALHFRCSGGQELRYGENPHQKATFYPDHTTGIGNMEQLHGKQLSYNNYLDGDAAIAVVRDLEGPAVCVVKHLNPCGIATGTTLRSALEAAWSGDIISAFGSVIAFSQEVDRATVEFFKGKFVEILIAPSFTNEAIEYIQAKSKNIRLLQGDFGEHRAQIRQLGGGMLEQTPDNVLFEQWECVTKEPFPDEKKALAAFTMTACKHTKSNACILGVEYEPGCYKVLGMGAGQPNRVNSFKALAVAKARENIERDGGDIQDAVFASDAFFPFDDTVRAAADARIKYIVQPGGSIKDKEVIATADELGIAMVFSGTRHFKH
ncbi:MAG: bifunctional phosphoribosylaminoimidazolecarboxamide formyltransferase/IMP cyclohydrolase [Candidatus Woesearchaeota archaeon]|nr:bifunctional phosphoribosylaminoimidazolecarboxamide formyltransferase/IMP cyclohydrolase [Candidatus Woesearchaeota archaeon]